MTRDSRGGDARRILIMGRMLQHVAGDEYDSPMAAHGRRMEADAIAALKAGFDDIGEHKKDRQHRRRRARNLPRA